MKLTADLPSKPNVGAYGATDGALRIYGLSALGITDSDYFVEDPSAPLQFVHTPNSGTARLVGTVHCRDNAAQIFHIDATFDNEDNAVDWLALSPMHSLLIADDPNTPGYSECAVDVASISVFDLAEGSNLVGDGDLSGVLQLSHMPASYNKRFQLGEGVNNHNCNYGLGGWFAWNGFINGTAVDGLSGDIVIDLDNCVEEQLECEEYAEFVFTAIDLDCGRVLTSISSVDRNDTTAPVITSGPLDATAECDAVPAVADNSEVIATLERLELMAIVQTTTPSYVVGQLLTFVETKVSIHRLLLSKTPLLHQSTLHLLMLLLSVTDQETVQSFKLG